MQWLSTVFPRAALLVVFFTTTACPVVAAPRSGELELHVVDTDTGKPLACRIHLKNARGRPRKAPGMPFLEDHFVFRSPIQLTLREGNYTFEVECGPEYHTQTGHFKMDRGGTDSKTLKMKRFVNMAKEGWWAGDLHVHRPVKDIDLLMQAEDLHLTEVVTWSNAKNEWERAREQLADQPQRNAKRHFEICAGRDGRKSGGLAIFPLSSSETKLPAKGFQAFEDASEEYPPGIELVAAWRDQEPVWIDAETPAARDLPIWVAHDLVDSVRLANHRYTRSGTAKQEPSAVPRDPARYPGTTGLGRWCEHIYYQLLECGLRIPPTAGSGSGDVGSPPGHNRVYVHCGDSFSPEDWWAGLKKGQVVVTNGPLLRVQVDGKPPGYVFQGKSGETLQLQPEVKLSVKEKVDYLEIVKNGRVVHAVSLQRGPGGKLPPLSFDQSGWFLIRVRAPSEKTYRFATTGPFYVEFEEPRISRQATRFFADWVAAQVTAIEIKDPEKRRKILGYYERAEEFWKKKTAQATAD